MSNLSPDPVSVSLAPSAAARISIIAAKQNRAPVLRLAVEGGGCSGWATRPRRTIWLPKPTACACWSMR
jgi:hypothetical protein